MKKVLFLMCILLTMVSSAQNFKIIKTSCVAGTSHFNTQDAAAIFELTGNNILVTAENTNVKFEAQTYEKVEVGIDDYIERLNCKSSGYEFEGTLYASGNKAFFYIDYDKIRFIYEMIRE
jgi:hypothetical protein